MIEVDRKSIPVPTELLEDGVSPGARERTRTATFYSVKANHEKPYNKFKAYKLPGVVKALNDLFNAKCAYCESNIGATQPTDVEHFRPKGGYYIRDKASKKEVFRRPGYHWLAASWDNLLPSCIDCNRERRQQFANSEPGLVGKANKFPLLREQGRATKINDETKEKPLLLNPCCDKPAEHLEFTNEGIVRPALDKRKKESRKGRISIEVYGLLRDGLVKERKERAIEVLASVKRLKDAELDLQDNPGNQRVQARIQDEIIMLKRYLAPASKYSGMSRQLIEREFGRVPT